MTDYGIQQVSAVLLCPSHVWIDENGHTVGDMMWFIYCKNNGQFPEQEGGYYQWNGFMLKDVCPEEILENYTQKGIHFDSEMARLFNEAKENYKNKGRNRLFAIARNTDDPELDKTLERDISNLKKINNRSKARLRKIRKEGMEYFDKWHGKRAAFVEIDNQKEFNDFVSKL